VQWLKCISILPFAHYCTNELDYLKDGTFYLTFGDNGTEKVNREGGYVIMPNEDVYFIVCNVGKPFIVKKLDINLLVHNTEDLPTEIAILPSGIPFFQCSAFLKAVGFFNFHILPSPDWLPQDWIKICAEGFYSSSHIYFISPEGKIYRSKKNVLKHSEGMNKK
jgi:hypothetical protein